MDYLIILDNLITNIIVCASDEIAAQFGAVPSYEVARIVDTYDPLPVAEGHGLINLLLEAQEEFI